MKTFFTSVLCYFIAFNLSAQIDSTPKELEDQVTPKENTEDRLKSALTDLEDKIDEIELDELKADIKAYINEHKPEESDVEKFKEKSKLRFEEWTSGDFSHLDDAHEDLKFAVDEIVKQANRLALELEESAKELRQNQKNKEIKDLKEQ